MQIREIDMHLRAGRYYGKLATCGTKIDYKSEPSATAAAVKMSKKSNRELEAYPCDWCHGWHIGRTMTERERSIFSHPAKIEMEIVDNLKVHNRVFCEGEHCSVHNPSDHRLKDAPLNWRADRRIMERICEHGIGHPDPDDAEYRRKRDGNRYDSGIHGCDGCC